MSNKAVKIGLTVVVLAVALAGLLRATLREGTEYYKHVNEVTANPAEWQGKNLQLHGYVVRDSILRKRDSLEYRFKVTSKVGESTHVVAARYTGIVPDTFSDDAEVVLKGKLGPDGFQVVPNGVMAKCPSKYEAQKKAAGAPGY
jgi:cytochrome c-type biogenesis protein CcmE